MDLSLDGGGSLAGSGSDHSSQGSCLTAFSALAVFTTLGVAPSMLSVPRVAPSMVSVPGVAPSICRSVYFLNYTQTQTTWTGQNRTRQ